jgi:hypothetical protein
MYSALLNFVESCWITLWLHLQVTLTANTIAKSRGSKLSHVSGNTTNYEQVNSVPLEMAW